MSSSSFRTKGAPSVTERKRGQEEQRIYLTCDVIALRLNLLLLKLNILSMKTYYIKKRTQ